MKPDSRTPTSKSCAAWTFGAVLFAIVATYYGAFYFVWANYPEVYYRSMLSLGVFAWKFPFLDTIAVLSWGDCHHAGISVLLNNPCDPLNRPLGYSPVLLDLPLYWLGVRHSTAVGIVMDFTFLVMLPLVLRPKSPRAFIIALTACLSPSVMFALERGNLDVFDFVLIAAATLYATRGAVQRTLSFWVYLAVGLLKFYPLVLLGLIIRERPRVALTFGLGAGGILIALAAHYWSVLGQTIPPEAHAMMRILVKSHYLAEMFGGLLLPFGIADFLRLPRVIGTIMFVALLIVAVLAAFRLRRRFKSELSVGDWDQPNFLLLAVGSVLIIGCFVAGPSMDYRAIFLLFIIPGLLELQSQACDRRVRIVTYYALCVTLLCLWQQFIEILLMGLGVVHPNLVSGFVFLLAREMLWWSLVSILTAFISVYVLQISVVARGWAARLHLNRPRRMSAVGS